MPAKKVARKAAKKSRRRVQTVVLRLETVEDRITRRLSRNGLLLCRTRKGTRASKALGQYFVVDRKSLTVVDDHFDFAVWDRLLGMGGVPRAWVGHESGVACPRIEPVAAMWARFGDVGRRSVRQSGGIKCQLPQPLQEPSKSCGKKEYSFPQECRHDPSSAGEERLQFWEQEPDDGAPQRQVPNSKGHQG